MTKQQDEKHSSEIFWPMDLLQKDFPKARVMTFGYNSNVSAAYAATNQSNIFSHARNLFYALDTKRGASDRRLIFTSHSLGGILVKEIL